MVATGDNKMRIVAVGLTLAVVVAGCGKSNPPQAQPPKAEIASQGISYTGGDGSSLEHAIVITGAKGESDGVKAEYGWLRQHHPTYRLLRQAVRSAGERIYDQMDITTPEGEKTVFFEITSFYGK